MTGNRRFVAIELKAKHGVDVGRIRDYLADNRKQLWAEAVAWWEAGDGPSARLPDHLAPYKPNKTRNTETSIRFLKQSLMTLLPT